MDYTKSKGNITELTCLMGFMSMGFDCSIPYGDCARYDMIVDTGDELLKVQCKSSSNPIRNGVRDLDAFHFSTVTQTANTKETIRRRYDDEQIDYFATCYDNKVYLVPVSECSTDNPIIANMDNYSVRENRVVLIRTIINTIIYSFTKQSSNQLNNQPNNF